MTVAILTPAQARTPMPDAGGAAYITAATSIPLPRPRPEAPNAADEKPSNPASVPSASEASDPSAPSACRLALTEAIAIAPSIPSIRGPGACGGEDMVRLEAVVLADRRRIPVKPAAILRCGMATAVSNWIRDDIAQLATGLGTAVNELDNFDSFECRGRNRVANAKLSEHGRANALDVRGIKLANGKSLALTDRSVARDLREKVMASLCARFTTVLGPGSDGYHEDHIHFDLAERRNGYRICQWQVYDPMPVAAPLLPAPRPDAAPPREVASQGVEPPRIAEPSRSVEQLSNVERLNVQPAPPPPVSLSPVPMAKQPTDVAKPVPAKPAKRDAAVAAKPGIDRPGPSKADPSNPDSSKSDPGKTNSDKSVSGLSVVGKPGVIRSGAAKPDARGRSAARQQVRDQPPLSIDPAGKTAERVAKPKLKRSKSSRARQQQPGLPVLLRRMFE